LALDAFLAIYYHQHPLKRGVDPKAHLISVINSIGANKMRSRENWLRAQNPPDPDTLADRHQNQAGPVGITGAQMDGRGAAGDAADELEEQVVGGRPQNAGAARRPPENREDQMQRAARLKQTLPSDWRFEAMLVDAVGLHGLRNRKALGRF